MIYRSCKPTGYITDMFSVPLGCILGWIVINAVLEVSTCKVTRPHAPREFQRSPCQHGDLND
jgi:hypothetical protein